MGPKENFPPQERGGSPQLQERKGLPCWWTRGLKEYFVGHHFIIFMLDPQVTIETPNYPENYPNKAKCNWKIKVPAGEEVHIWCESFDVLKGDFLRVKNREILWSNSYPLPSDQGGDLQGLWIIWGRNWRDPSCHKQGQVAQDPVQVQQEEERWWLQMPGWYSMDHGSWFSIFNGPFPVCRCCSLHWDWIWIGLLHWIRLWLKHRNWLWVFNSHSHLISPAIQGP